MAKDGSRDRSKRALAALFGAFDPLLRKSAQGLAAKTPADSIFRSPLVESAVGALKGLLESFSDKMPALASVAVEKLTDFGDFFAGALGEVGEKEGKAVIDKWMAAFFDDAGKRLKKAGERAPEEAKRIRKEFALRMAILDQIEKAIKARAPKDAAAPKMSLRKDMRKFLKFWRTKITPQYHDYDRRVARRLRGWMKDQTWLRP